MFKKSLFVKVTSLALTVILVCGMMASCGGKKKFDSDAEYVGYVNAREVGKITDSVSEATDFDFEFGNISTDMSIKIELGDEGRELIEDLGVLGQIGLDDLDWFEDIEIAAGFDWDDDKLQLEAELGLNGDEIVTGYAGIDFGEGTVCIGVPTLSSEYYEVELPEETRAQFAQIEELLNSDQFEAIEGLLNDPTRIGNILERYVELAFGKIDRVKSSDDELEIGKLSEDCEKYVATIDDETLFNIAVAVLEELKDDKEVFDLLDDLGLFEQMNMSEDDLKDEIEDLLEDADEDAIGESGIPEIRYTTYIDDDELIGLEARFEVDGEDVDIHFYNVRDGKEFASECVINVPGKVSVSVEGDGTVKDDKYTGDFALYVNGTKFVKIVVEDFESKGGKASGSITISPDEGLFDLFAEEADLPGAAAALIKKFGIRLTFGDDELELALMNGDDVYLALTIGMEFSSKAKVSFPKNTTDDPEEWAEGLDVEEIFDNLEDAGFPSELLEMITEGLGGREESDSPVFPID